MALPKPDQLLRDLIAIPSVNPAFLPPGDPRGGEGPLGQYLVETAKAHGLDAERQEVAPGRSNVLIHFLPSGRPRQRLLLAPHMDTVGYVEMSERHFQPEARRGRMHGRGACDTKGSIAAMFSAILALAQETRRPEKTAVTLAALVDEENEQSGSRALVKSRFKAHLAIVGEPTQLQVVTAHKGDLWLQLETRGRCAHGSRPELGKNAVHAMAKVVDAIESRYAAMLRKRRHPLLGSPTVNVGSISGGTQPNIVPDRCVISIDRRTIPGETESRVRKEILRLLQEHDLKVDLASSKAAPCLPMETDPRLPLVSQFLFAAGQSNAMGVDFFCDAAILSAGGIPSVVFGPGDIAQAHTADEWISLRSLDGAASILKRFLLSQP